MGYGMFVNKTDHNVMVFGLVQKKINNVVLGNVLMNFLVLLQDLNTT
jgi:membrane-bound acyltransferase YfiQ involved in biofilm formation